MDVKKRNQTCDGNKDYDPCEVGFVCDRADSKVCLPQSRYAGIGDGCLTDSYCLGRLICDFGPKKCVFNSSLIYCANDNECPINQFCDTSTPNASFCTPSVPKGQPCGAFKCLYGLYCNPDNSACTEYFTLGENVNCFSTAQCQTGLFCYKNKDGTSKCTKPTYRFGIGPAAPVAWGQECIARISSGCSCNNVGKVTQYLKEQIRTYKDGCKVRTNEFVTCLNTNKCYAPTSCLFGGCNVGADTCIRNKCYPQYKSMVVDCSADPGLVGEFCGANTISIFISMMVLFTLLI
jgi:hypothetical protein